MERVGRAIHMVGQFIQVWRGDEEATAARITYELEESTEATVREARYRAEYEQAEQQLAAELSMQAPKIYNTLRPNNASMRRPEYRRWKRAWQWNMPRPNPTCTTPT